MEGQIDDDKPVFHAIRWLDDRTATRFTHEVDLKCEIKEENGVWTIKLTGVADLEHHLVEDAAILLKKMCAVKCGDHSI